MRGPPPVAPYPQAERILWASEVRKAEQDSGIPVRALIRTAGRRIAEKAIQMLRPGGRVLILCGPGHNGADGFAAGEYLRERGYQASGAYLVPRDRWRPDTAWAADKWIDTYFKPAHAEEPGQYDLVIDAMFGAGLARRPDRRENEEVVEGSNDVIKQLNRSGVPVLSADIPSGLEADTGNTIGAVVQATNTLAIVALKPAHLLWPGRSYCGHIEVADIGVHPSMFGSCLAFANGPSLWAKTFPRPAVDAHKFQRGSVLVLSGGIEGTGAARLAARAALRIGAGLVTLAVPPDALAVQAAANTAVMVRKVESLEDWVALGRREHAAVLGPAAGVGETLRERVKAVRPGCGLVLDADALRSFERRVPELAAFTRERSGHENEPRTVLTPHAGEFVDLFQTNQHLWWRPTADHMNRRVIHLVNGEHEPFEPDSDWLWDQLKNKGRADHIDEFMSSSSKLKVASAIAEIFRAVIVMKGPDTVVASRNFAAVNVTATPYLATAGSGDVLAGMIGGLLAQGMPAFEAACAAVWLHGTTGIMVGPGLIAEDLSERLPDVLAELLGSPDFQTLTGTRPGTA